MSGFTIRRFTLQNIVAVATHCPIPGVAPAALRITYGAGFESRGAGGTSSTSTSTSSSDASTPSSSSSSSNSGGAAAPTDAWLTSRLTSLLVGGGGGAGRLSSAGFALVTEDEMLWIQRRRREEAEESRVVLATRPTRNILRGLGGAVLNVGLGCLLSPLVFLSVTLEKLRVSQNIGVGLVVGPLHGAAWGGIFLAVALYAALQQALLSVWYSCVAAPARFLINRPLLLAGGGDIAGAAAAAVAAEEQQQRRAAARARFWSPLTCSFAVPYGVEGASDPLLRCFDENEILRDRAMKRLAVRGKKDKAKAQYKQKQAGEDDYYGLLGVGATASEREIKAAYNRLVLKIHPDKNPAPGAAAHFDNVTKAYRVLSNREKRKRYDLGGAKGVEDLGAKKREGVRALFGGDALVALCGDVFLGSFSMRVIDGLDHTQEELAVLRERMYNGCRDELLSGYLSHYLGGTDTVSTAPSSSSSGAAQRSAAPSSSSLEDSMNAWDGKMRTQLRKIVSTGLAKEVLYVVGKEYLRVIAYFDAALTTTTTEGASTPSPAQSGRIVAAPVATTAARRAALYVNEVGPHRWQQRVRRFSHYTKVRSDTFKSSEAMVDLAWYSSVEELELTARTIAQSILFDPVVPAAEVARRRAALSALATVFVHYGQPYKGADKRTMDSLMNSLRDYQQQQQREKDAR